MKAYRVYYDKSDKKWKYENFLSEVNCASDFEFWNVTLLSAESNCINYNRYFVADAKDMYSSNHYTICTCKECKEEYILPYDEYCWFIDKGLSVPKRCSRCRKKRRIYND